MKKNRHGFHGGSVRRKHYSKSGLLRIQCIDVPSNSVGLTSSKVRYETNIAFHRQKATQTSWLGDKATVDDDGIRIWSCIMLPFLVFIIIILIHFYYDACQSFIDRMSSLFRKIYSDFDWFMGRICRRVIAVSVVIDAYLSVLGRHKKTIMFLVSIIGTFLIKRYA